VTAVRIAVDVEPFYRNRAGVGRYVEGILGGLTRLGENDEFTLFRSRSYAGKEDIPGLVRDRVREKVLPLSHRALQLGWMLTGRPLVEKYVGDHELYVSPGVPAFPTHGKLAVVVYDMVWAKFPEFYPRHSVWLRRIGFRRVVRKCTGIVTISEASRRDILEATGFEERRVRTAYPGVEPRLCHRPTEEEISRVLERFAARPPYVLTIAGDNGPKKNLGNLVRAMGRLAADHREATLVNVGEPRYDVRGVGRLIAELGMSERVRFLGRVSDDELRSLYAGARLTAYPSFYEGFGFPLVESMALGTPVVTSNVSAMPEVAGGAALLVNPRDVEELSGAIGSLLGDDRLHARLRAKGLERVKDFRWETSARQTRDFFAELVGE
jgi:glycosyltransferase involved in cell wall biosynthesis